MCRPFCSAMSLPPAGLPSLNLVGSCLVAVLRPHRYLIILRPPAFSNRDQHNQVNGHAVIRWLRHIETHMQHRLAEYALKYSTIDKRHQALFRASVTAYDCRTVFPRSINLEPALRTGPGTRSMPQP